MAAPGSSVDQPRPGIDPPGPNRGRWAAVLQTVLVGATSIGTLAVSATAVLAFFALIVGGGIYRVSCETGSSSSQSWRVEGDLPYLWSAGGSCSSHSLTRFVIGKVGLMSGEHTGKGYRRADLVDPWARYTLLTTLLMNKPLGLATYGSVTSVTSKEIPPA